MAKNPNKNLRDYNEKFDHSIPVPVVKNGEVRACVSSFYKTMHSDVFLFHLEVEYNADGSRDACVEVE